MFVNDNREPNFVFGHSVDPSEVYISIIEKAFAKLYGCYESLNGGIIEDSISVLSRLKTEKLKLKNQNKEQI